MVLREYGSEVLQITYFWTRGRFCLRRALEAALFSLFSRSRLALAASLAHPQKVVDMSPLTLLLRGGAECKLHSSSQ